MWDDHYGAQPNPYGVEGFKTIYKALKRLPSTEHVAALLVTTHEALAVESGLFRNGGVHFDYDIGAEVKQHECFSDGQRASIMKLVERGKFEAALGAALAVAPEDHAQCFEKHLDKLIEFQKLVEGL